MDSIDAIPFANDNAGTIKQRAMGGNQYHQNYNSSSSSSSSSLATTVNAQGTCVSVTAVMSNASVASSSALADDIIECGAEGSATNSTSRNSTIDSNVLNDIGNMLANLTDELDAMLEEEKRAGINDSE